MDSLRVAPCGKNYGFPQTDLDVYNISKGGKEPIVCDAVEDRFSDNPCVVLKTHSPFKENQPFHQLPNVELVNAAFIHIYRNPLDVLLSYLNFTRIEYKFHIENSTYKNNLFIELLGLPRTYDYDEWLGMSLDAIPQANLDHALDCFSENIDDVERARMLCLEVGLKTHNHGSIYAGKLPGYSIRYEDCLENSESFCKIIRIL